MKERTYPIPKMVGEIARTALASSSNDDSFSRAGTVLASAGHLTTSQVCQLAETQSKLLSAEQKQMLGGDIGRKWVTKIVDSLYRDRQEREKAVLASIGYSTLNTYLAAFDPNDDSIVRGVIRVTATDDVHRLAETGDWKPVRREILRAYDYAEIDSELLAFTASAFMEGLDGVILSFAEPIAFLPMTPILASIDEPLASAGEFIYAIVDTVDTSAVMDVIKLAPGPTAYIRENGAWKISKSVLDQLLGVSPPPLVELTGDALEAVIEQLDASAVGEEVADDVEQMKDMEEDLTAEEPEEDPEEDLEEAPLTKAEHLLESITAAAKRPEDREREYDESKHKRGPGGLFARKPKASLALNSDQARQTRKDRRNVRIKAMERKGERRYLRRSVDEAIDHVVDAILAGSEENDDLEKLLLNLLEVRNQQTVKKDDDFKTKNQKRLEDLDTKLGEKDQTEQRKKLRQELKKRTADEKKSTARIKKLRQLGREMERARKRHDIELMGLQAAELDRRAQMENYIADLRTRIYGPGTPGELASAKAEYSMALGSEAVQRRTYTNKTKRLNDDWAAYVQKMQIQATKLAMTASAEMREELLIEEPIVLAPLLSAGGADRNRGNAETLRRYWVSGKGALKIKWGTEGDWRRCVKHLTKYLGVRAKGYCQLRHKEATGLYTGNKLHRQGVNTIKASGVRRVRSPEGAEHFGQSIGEIIRADIPVPKARMPQLQGPARMIAATREEAQAALKYREEKFGEKAPAIPPAWTSIRINADYKNQTARALVLGTAGNGKTQSIYSEWHRKTAEAEKFARLAEIADKIHLLDEQLEADTSETALVVRMIRRTGMRVASGDGETQGEPTYGATTLQARHVSVEGDTISFDFVGKSGKRNTHVLTDSVLARALAERKSTIGENEELFPSVRSSHTIDYLRQHLGMPDAKNHDLRTLFANTLALREIRKRAPQTVTEWRRMRNEVGDIVAEAINDSRTVALNSYIANVLFTEWDTVPITASVEPITEADEDNLREFIANNQSAIGNRVAQASDE